MRLASSVFLLPMLLGACDLGAGAQLRPAGCPSVSLRPNLDGGRMLPSSSETRKRTVTVTLGGPGDNAVIAADITLLGVESPAGAYPVVTAKPLRVPFHLVQPAGAEGALIVELALPPSMTSVSGATVDGVSFRNGETWKPASQATCTVGLGTGLLAKLP
jgi:hypothetical protein